MTVNFMKSFNLSMGPILIAKYPTACKVQVILTQVELMGRIG